MTKIKLSLNVKLFPSSIKIGYIHASEDLDLWNPCQGLCIHEAVQDPTGNDFVKEASGFSTGKPQTLCFVFS